MEKLIMTVATTGAATTLDKCPNLAITPKQIADEVYACYQKGAVCCHIHVREDDGARSMSYAKYEETMKRIRDKCDILINFTTSGQEFSHEIRMASLDLRPNLASFNSGSLNFARRAFVNPPDYLEELAQRMDRYGVKPEFEVFDSGMIANAIRLRDNGFVHDPMHFQIVLGVQGGMPASPTNLLFMVNMLPKNATWSVVGVGKYSMMVWSMAIQMGGHVRFGMEDNIYLRHGVKAASNADFIDQIKQLADLFERPIATLEDAKRIWSLE